MIPYIVVLVFLIVMILFQVYRMEEEGFNTVPTSTTTTAATPQTTESEKKYKDMEERIVKDIVKQLKDELFAKEVYVKRSESLNTETTSTDDTSDESDKNLEKSLIKSIVKQMRSEVLPTYKNAASSKKTTSKDAEVDDIDSDTTDFTSDKYNKELQDRLIKSVTKQLKDEMLLERAMTNLKDNNEYALPSPYAATNMTQQGCEYKSGAPLNMDEYIRKDSIPCYGCTLPA